MKKKSFVTLSLVLLSLVLLSACGVFQEVEAPSATLEAIPLETQAAGVATTAPVEPTAAPEVATEPAAEEPTAALATEEATTVPPTEEPTATPTPAGVAPGITIDPAASQERSELDEDLSGSLNTEVGTTDQRHGQH